MEDFIASQSIRPQFYTDTGLDVDAFEKEVDQLLDELPSVEGGNVRYGQSMSQNLFHLLSEADQLKMNFKTSIFPQKSSFMR